MKTFLFTLILLPIIVIGHTFYCQTNQTDNVITIYDNYTLGRNINVLRNCNSYQQCLLCNEGNGECGYCQVTLDSSLIITSFASMGLVTEKISDTSSMYLLPFSLITAFTGATSLPRTVCGASPATRSRSEALRRLSAAKAPGQDQKSCRNQKHRRERKEWHAHRDTAISAARENKATSQRRS